MKRSNPSTEGEAQSKEASPKAQSRDLRMSRPEAAAGSPSDYSVAGEEDPGVGLEFVVRKKK